MSMNKKNFFTEWVKKLKRFSQKCRKFLYNKKSKKNFYNEKSKKNNNNNNLGICIVIIYFTVC